MKFLVYLAEILPPNDPFNIEDLKNVPIEPVDTSKFASEFLYMLMILGLLIAVMIAASWYLKKMMNVKVDQLNSDSYIKVLERRALSQKSALYLIDVNGSQMVVGETPNGLVQLGKVNAAFEEEIEEDNG